MNLTFKNTFMLLEDWNNSLLFVQVVLNHNEHKGLAQSSQSIFDRLYFVPTRKSLLSKITVNKKLNHWLSMNQTLKFDGLKRHSPISFLSSYFIAIIDIFHIISKNILDNNARKYVFCYHIVLPIFSPCGTFNLWLLTCNFSLSTNCVLCGLFLSTRIDYSSIIIYTFAANSIKQ